MKQPIFAAIALALLSSAGPSLALDSSISGFGTLGYARSDQSFGYQRFITDRGTIKRDSVFGVQVDSKITNEFSLTAQAKVGPSTSKETGYAANISWAFLSYRPSNDLLLRAGKFRVPFYLHSETTDVGTTFDFARLPSEVYSQSPTTDFKGLQASKSWDLGGLEAVVDAYWGSARTNLRLWFRDDLLPIQPAGAQLPKIGVEVRGLALTVRRDEDIFRANYTHAIVTSHDERLFSPTYPFVGIPGVPGVGYFQTVGDAAGKRIPVIPQITIPLITLGADIKTQSGFRFVGEYGRRIVRDTDLGFDTAGAYLAVLRESGSWTPYLSYAVLRSTARNRQFYAALNGNSVPEFIPGAAFINASQRAGADGAATFDQASLAIGTSYSPSRTSRIKAEIQQVRIGEVSALVDAPPGSNVRHQGIRVLSLSYSVVF